MHTTNENRTEQFMKTVCGITSALLAISIFVTVVLLFTFFGNGDNIRSFTKIDKALVGMASATILFGSIYYFGKCKKREGDWR